MHHLRLAFKHVFELRQPRLGQTADLCIIAQDALHDHGFSFALLGQQFMPWDL